MDWTWPFRILGAGLLLLTLLLVYLGLAED